VCRERVPACALRESGFVAVPGRFDIVIYREVIMLGG
jgi:hypothetical protein